jgi:biotin carboxyl carrier protein
MEMEYLVEGKTYKVKIDADESGQEKADGFKATIGEKEYRFNVTQISDNCFSLLHANNSRIAYVAQADGKIYVYIDGKVINLENAVAQQKTFSKDSLEFGVKDEVTTSMPGKVVKVLVKEGDKVKVKQPLVIVESMKMENEIKSLANGVVKSIHFGSGDLVEPGQPIIKLELDE